MLTNIVFRNGTAVVVFLALYAAAFKPESMTFTYDKFSIDIDTMPLFWLLQDLSIFCVIAILIVVVTAVLSRGRLTGHRLNASKIYITMTLYSALLAIFHDVDLGRKILAQCGLALMMLIYLTLTDISRYTRTIDQIYKGLLMFSIVLVFVNTLNYLGGFGFFENGTRYFGTTAHPNFMGVQLALVSIVLCYYLSEAGPYIYKYTAVLALLISCSLMYFTGSRTSIGMFILGSFYIIVGRRLSKIIYLFAAAAIIIGGYVVLNSYFLSGTAEIGDAFDRGGDPNTRSQAWAALALYIEQAPLFGIGYLPSDFSENSFLRAWASFGVFYFIFMIILYLLIFARAIILFVGIAAQRRGILFGALTVALTCGAVLEGYLIDTFSVQSIALLYTVIASDMIFASKVESVAIADPSSRTERKRARILFRD